MDSILTSWVGLIILPLLILSILFAVLKDRTTSVTGGKKIIIVLCALICIIMTFVTKGLFTGLDMASDTLMGNTAGMMSGGSNFDTAFGFYFALVAYIGLLIIPFVLADPKKKE